MEENKKPLPEVAFMHRWGAIIGPVLGGIVAALIVLGGIKVMFNKVFDVARMEQFELKYRNR